MATSPISTDYLEPSLYPGEIELQKPIILELVQNNLVDSPRKAPNFPPTTPLESCLKKFEDPKAVQLVRL